MDAQQQYPCDLPGYIALGEPYIIASARHCPSNSAKY